jgi:hypothetical protein
MLATVHVTVIWGAILAVVGVVHLTFRRYYARRATVMQRAHRDAAPRATQGLHWVGNENTNLTLGTLGGVAFIVLGVVLLIAGLI